MTVYYFFKLFNNIKSEHEAKDFAKLELNGLFGNVKPIRNFIDIILDFPFNVFTKDPIRIQDIITHELAYGKLQGYYAEKPKIEDITKLVKRLGYTREIFVVLRLKGSISKTLKILFSDAVLGKNAQYFKEGDYVLFRFITNQYFLEKSQYISKLSRNEEEIDMNVETLFSHLTKNIFRIPASSTLTIGKRLEDYFAIREEPSLYLNHYIHPYKGKFHPKMVRALLNYIHPWNKGIILDNFAGSGTLLLEASFLGLDSFGVEINSLSVLMCNVKCDSLRIDLKKLKNEIKKYIRYLEDEIKLYFNDTTEQKLLISSRLKKEKINKIVNELSKKFNNNFKNKEYVITKIIIARELLKFVEDEKIRDFLLLSLSGAISDVIRRTSNQFEKALEIRINDLYLRLYLFHRLNEVLKIKLGDSKTFVSDTRNMKEIKENSITGIVNSPPYSTALDYIKNDYPQLILLELTESMENLEKNMMGNPRVNYDKKQLLNQIKNKDKDPLFISKLAENHIMKLLNNDRQQAGLRCYKFFVDMIKTFEEMNRVLTPDAKCAIIIGNNHFMLNGGYIEIPNDDILLDIGQKLGFKINDENDIIKRELQKTSSGNIQKETVLIFKKN